MPFAIAGPVLGSVAGAVVSGAMAPSSSGGSGGGPGSYYVPTGLTSSDQAWQNLLSGEQSAQGGIQGLLPYYGQSLQGGMNALATYGNLNAQRANEASNQYYGLGQAMNQQGWQNLGTQANLLGAGQQIYNMGLDPQSALYGRTLQQLQDQTGATNSMYGLGSSAAGAGVANQALSNFNIDWQNNQLSRALQGLQGYAGAANTAGRYGELGTSQLQSVPGYTNTSGQLPLQTSLSYNAMPGQLASQYASGVEQGPLSSAQSIMSGIIPYMNYGQGAQAVPFQAASQGAGALGSMVSQGISGALNSPTFQGWASNAFSSPTGSFSGGDFSGAFNSNPYYSGGGNSWGFTMQ